MLDCCLRSLRSVINILAEIDRDMLAEFSVIYVSHTVAFGRIRAVEVSNHRAF